MFSTRLTVNFGDTDPAALVYFPNIFHYSHIAMEQFFEEVCTIRYSDLVGEKRIGFPTVKIEAEFMQPLRYGDIIDIQLVVKRVGNKSLTFSYSILNDSGVLCAAVEQIVVAMDLATHQSMTIPDWIRERLAPMRLDGA